MKRQRTEPVPPLEVHPELWAAVADLPDRQREAIALRYVSGLTETEVAATMGVTDGSASATLSKARRRLAEVLRDEPVEEDVT